MRRSSRERTGFHPPISTDTNDRHLVQGEADADVVLNSLLSAYGLPTIKFGKGAFKVYDDFDQDFTFEYPR